VNRKKTVETVAENSLALITGLKPGVTVHAGYFDSAYEEPGLPGYRSITGYGGWRPDDHLPV